MPDVVTSDGVRLSYSEAGSGPPLIIIPGIAQPKSVFVHQLEGLRERCRVIVYDQRGHGDSDKPAHGYRISRLAKDLDELIEALGLAEITLMGWSLGCAVAWSYYDLFGPKRLARLILVDGSVLLCETPEMTEQDIADTGAAWDAAGALGIVSAIRNDQEELVRRLVSSFVTDERTDVEWLIGEALRMPAEATAALMFDYVYSDWRDVIPRIALPTLIVGATRSHIPVSVQEWLHRTIPDSQLAVLRDRAHLLFYEEPETFNELVARFVGEPAPVPAGEAARARG
ncbi:alpha/beta hydrolase [Micromonospora sp. PLK6-60]|uniref:alpha/beta fold hydrolase n=1 Tax=Micromonospora sp. PLK6-60 TaxID=2873383 RepID=UPI001CA7480F|nr:alpha/beta hydrolase [Micromonospora sp. PLK6-60]MBY8870798.1 alpha/beta hydrolase [Micromonospora sp. PLK6-60]